MKTKKTILTILTVLFTFTLVSNIEAQMLKKKDSKVTSIKTAAPTKAIEVNGVILNIFDLKGQLDNLAVLRLEDEAKGIEPRDPVITLIKDEEMGESAFRLAETLEEAALEADSVTVLKFKFSVLGLNMRTKYN